MKSTILYLLLLLALPMSAQIVTTTPSFPKVTDEVVITYDATLGNGGLADLPLGTNVYVHTGLADASGSWNYVVGDWGTDDDRVIMSRIGDTDLYQFTFTPSLLDWFNENNNSGETIPGSADLAQIGLVFRNADGSLEGKTEDFQDIFIPLFSENSGLVAKFLTPADDFIVSQGEEINVVAVASTTAMLSLYDNGDLLVSVTNDTLEHSFNATSGNHELLLEAENGGEIYTQSLRYVVSPPVEIEALPAGTELGMNVLDDQSIRLALYAPFKEFVYVIGDFNDWSADANYYMRNTPDGNIWWLDVTGLDPDMEYAFQYWVDGKIKIGDPYSEKVLDPWNDQFIPERTYPDLKPYPAGKTTEPVTAFKINKPTFNWQYDDYERPAKEDLVVYELLLRDFVETHDYQTLIDSLDYLERLGVNAIQLMPVSEFEGNSSWGYNPSFHMALDKYYGTPEAFKTFVDECHRREIAVILDVVYNHAFGQNPMVRLYFDGAPTEENPWFNREATHAFNVGYDFNHESQATTDYFDRVMTYWIEEYHVDGYRFDLSKGLTQNPSGDFGAGGYDQSRIDIIKHMADVIWAVDPDFYVILEHFVDNSEEKVLAQYGMMLWANFNYEFNEATMGYSSNFEWASYKERTWNVPHAVVYMESHDEERTMYKNLRYGHSNSSGTYDVTDTTTALQRNELGAVFLFSIPGPKMIWQMGELGYDHSIFTCSNGVVDDGDVGCKLSEKPIRWDYLEDEHRVRLFDVFSEMIKLKKEQEVFSTTDFDMDVARREWKRIQLNSSEMNVTVIGNFDVNAREINPNFRHNGWWYSYFTGDSINVSDRTKPLNLEAGEYRLFTDVNIGFAAFAESDQDTIITPTVPAGEAVIYPNPAARASGAQLVFNLSSEQNVEVVVFDTQGKLITEIWKGRLPEGANSLPLEGSFAPGVYLVELKIGDNEEVLRWLVHK